MTKVLAYFLQFEKRSFILYRRQQHKNNYTTKHIEDLMNVDGEESSNEGESKYSVHIIYSKQRPAK